MRAQDLDLRELLTTTSESGVIQFMGQRVLIFDALALGLLREELIDTLGMHTARGILTRFGYAHGWRTAEMLRRDYPELFKDAYTGPRLHSLCGLMTPGITTRSDGKGEAPLVEGTWHDSYEAEQHQLHFGTADEPTCWTLTGFASGYVSNRTGREVYFLEKACCGMGDPVCQIEGRFKEMWDTSYKSQLSYYHQESFDAVLAELTSKLKSVEKQLKHRQRQLSCFDIDDDLPCVSCRSPAMRKTAELAKRIAGTDSSVVISGETGVGKERIAQYIHDESTRSGRPFVALNCGALTESLLESELFGYAKGSFTGAVKDSVGLFEAANGGTLFLDEIGEISAGMQVKILRVLQEKEIRRIGENKTRPVDFRIVSATNRNLSEEVSAGRFRQDLYYRLRVIELRVPPVRERHDDILPLARVFLSESAKRSNRKITAFSPQAAKQLLSYHWPGNVRELQNVVEYGVALAMGNRIELEDLPEELQTTIPQPALSGEIRSLEEVEKNYILSALKTLDGNKAKTAEALNIGIATLYRKLNAYETS
ncbi:sigma-54-dependent Fis family transcriptional regulator [uncultured Desulfuromonas sp.]|uniref:sigma-54-dependent Fis family transcriptional regulator n=1 Tax=uncultured Desulfuromonas sp. TaxID=181013 RepID=UPI002AAB9C8C|nr:sigma-54-dependent Fis family transcriptional regulator [uncultured Desulfuromonas sp.]